MRKKYKFFVSTENKILLHLSRFIKVEPTKKVPQEITQVGIANNLGSPRGSVSRALGNLIEKGFIEEKLCRVESSKRRMNAYFLTWEGRTFEESLENKLVLELVEVRTNDGVLNEVTVAEALELSGNGLTISQLLRIIEIHGYYDPNLHEPDSQKDETVTGSAGIGVPVESKQVAASTISPAPTAVEALGTPTPPPKDIPQYMRVPSVRTFYGRTEELEKYPVLLKEHPVVIIKGMAGIGKTTFTAKMLSQFDPTWKILWYRLQEWDNARSILQIIAEFLNAHGNSALLKELQAQHTDMNMYTLTKILVQEFYTVKGLIVIDDFHRASESVQQFFTGIIEHLDSKALIHTLLLSRTHLPIFDTRDSSFKKTVHELLLKGLDYESSREMLGSRKIQEKDFKKVYSVTNGHPLALELIKNSGHVAVFTDMMKFINEQVFQKLDKDERSALMAISVHRNPVPIPAFLVEEEADFDTVDNLINKTLLVESEPNTYFVHDLIREFFYSRLIAKKRKDYHLHAAEFFETDSDELSALEAVYHFIKADKMDRAAEMMISKSPALIQRGYLDEAMNILTKFDSNVSTEYLVRLYNIKGDILSTWGEWDNVFEYYFQCYFLNMIDSEPKDKNDVLRSFGYIGWKPSEVEVALGNLRSSLDVLQESGDLEGITEIENSLAWLNWMTGAFTESEKIYKGLQDKMEKNNDRPGTAKILIKLGNVYWGDKQFDRASDSYFKGLEVFRELKDDYGIARTLSHIALVELELRDFNKASKHLEKSIRLSSDNQLKRTLAYGMLHTIQAYILQEEYEKATAELEGASNNFEILKDMLGLAYLSVCEGLINKFSKQNKRAIGKFENALHNLRGFLMPYYKSKLYTELSSLYKLAGESDKAVQAKQNAIEKQDQNKE